MARNDPHKITQLNAQVEGFKGGGDMEDSDIGEVFYVNNDSSSLLVGAEPGADVSGFGKSPLQPLATIDYAIGLCSAGRGDKIIVLQGHSETVTAAITMDVAGVTVEGRGQGANRAQVSCATASIDMLTITAANCVLRNILFNESTADVSAMVNVAAADVLIENCQFDLGATDEECITWASGSRLTVKDNVFNVTANGPDRAIEIESTNDGLICTGNLFNGGSATNVFDNAAINSAQAHTNAYIDDNTFMYGIALIVATSVSTAVGPKNRYLLGSQSNAAAPQSWYCDLGTTIRDGRSPETPTTLNDSLVTKATAGDTVYVLAGSTVTLTTSQAMSVAGVKLVGLGEGGNRPTITGNGTVDLIDMTGASCTVENIVFAAATAAVTADINIGAANCTVRKCKFSAGASDTNAVITIPDAGDNVLIENNEFLITANGPAIAISIESASCDRGIIRGNLFNGGSGTNQWDTAAINSGVAHTNYIIEKNSFLYGTAHAVSSSVSTLVRDNVYGVGAVPSSTTPIVFYADSGATVRDGLSMDTPTTVANAISKARDGVGDSILLLPGTYTLTAAYALSKAAMRFGPAIDNGSFNVTVTTASDVDLVTLTGASVEIWGIRFVGHAAQVTTPALIDLDTGDFCHIHDCYFDAVSVASLVSIDIASTATDTKVVGNYFTAQAATVGSIVDLGARTMVLDNYFNQIAADGYAINNDGMAVGGALYLRNYFIGDGGSNSAMCLLDTTAPVSFLFAHNILGGTSSATPIAQDSEFTTHFVNNYCPGNTVSGGTLIDPVA